MEIISHIIDFILHMDEYLDLILQTVGAWTYAVLWLVIFIETGLVITPFLPGDSLLFAAGAFAARGHFQVVFLWLMLFLAAFLGDTVNYWIGHFIGPKVFQTNSRLIKKEYLERTKKFYDKHGGITIFLARFIPIIRTFAPFVAGVGQMRYGYFITYNIIGGGMWTAAFIFLGYFFGNLQFVKDHFSLIIIAMILIPGIPALIEAFKAARDSKKKKDTTVTQSAPEQE